jgi:hypothetical protein
MGFEAAESSITPVERHLHGVKGEIVRQGSGRIFVRRSFRWKFVARISPLTATGTDGI